MASVLVVSIAPLLRDLVGDLATLTHHTPLLVDDWRMPATPMTSSPDVFMLDASLPTRLCDSWVCRAADNHAVVIYFASLLSDEELRAFAAHRNAPHFALPNGPRLLGEVLGGALARPPVRAAGSYDAAEEDVTAAAATDRVNASLFQSSLALPHARQTVRAAVEARRENRRLRDERDLLLSLTRQRRVDLRESVLAYASALRRAGSSLEGAITLVRDAISAVPDPSPATTATVPVESDLWVLEAFRAA